MKPINHKVLVGLIAFSLAFLIGVVTVGAKTYIWQEHYSHNQCELAINRYKKLDSLRESNIKTKDLNEAQKRYAEAEILTQSIHFADSRMVAHTRLAEYSGLDLKRYFAKELYKLYLQELDKQKNVLTLDPDTQACEKCSQEKWEQPFDIVRAIKNLDEPENALDISDEARSQMYNVTLKTAQNEARKLLPQWRGSGYEDSSAAKQLYCWKTRMHIAPQDLKMSEGEAGILDNLYSAYEER